MTLAETLLFKSTQRLNPFMMHYFLLRKNNNLSIIWKSLLLPHWCVGIVVRNLNISNSKHQNDLLLSHFSRVRLCATPEMAAYQAPPSLGFSRQEQWSGLPFPSPMQESEKWKWSRWVGSDSATPWTAAYQAPPSMGFSRQEYWSGVPLPSPSCKYSHCQN